MVKRMKIKTIVKWFEFCLDEALDMHGATIGGPYEYQHAKDLRLAERALKELKKYRYDAK